MVKQNKMRFTKKIFWSITNVNKYDDMIGLGLKKSIQYLIGIIAILAVILSIFGSYIQSVNVGEIVQYLNDNLPKMTLEKQEDKYELSTETDDVIILEDNKFIDSFKSVVVINKYLEENEAIDEYSKLANNGHSCAIFLKDKCIVVTENKQQVNKYNYSELLNKYTKSNNEKYTKVDVLNYLGNTSYTYYIFAYFVNYFTILLTVFALDVIIIGVLSMIVSRILKLTMNKKEIFSMSIYALTLSAILYIVYLIASYLNKFSFEYINIINMIIAYIYVSLYFWKKRKKDVASN